MPSDTSLRYAKPRGSLAHPTMGVVWGNATATLTTRTNSSLVVGPMLGTDYSFMEPVRSLMILGVDVALNAISNTAFSDADRRTLYTHIQDNAPCGPDACAMHILTANSAAAGGSGGIPNAHGQATGGACTWVDPQWRARDPAGVPCRFATPGQRVVLYQLDVAATAGVRRGPQQWWTEGSRRPFQYQALCYAGARAAAQHQAEALAQTHAGFPVSESGSGHTQTTQARHNTSSPFRVKVAMLQLNAIPMANPASDPVPAHLAKAEQWIARAARSGADVAVLPEMWSVGSDRNWHDLARRHYLDLDSAAVLYDSVARWAQPRSGPYITRLQAVARTTGIAIAAPFLEEVAGPGAEQWGWDPLPPRNSVALIDSHGAVLYTYAKVHVANTGVSGTPTTTPPFEGFTMQGRSFPVANLDVRYADGYPHPSCSPYLHCLICSLTVSLTHRHTHNKYRGAGPAEATESPPHFQGGPGAASQVLAHIALIEGQHRDAPLACTVGLL